MARGNKHSRKTNTIPGMSYSERKRAYGQRATGPQEGGLAGTDAQRPFDSCALCLSQAMNPVLTNPSGFLFCRRCILQYYLDTKKQLLDAGKGKPQGSSSHSEAEGKPKGDSVKPRAKKADIVVPEPFAARSPSAESKVVQPRPLQVRTLIDVEWVRDYGVVHAEDDEAPVICAVCGGRLLDTTPLVVPACGHVACKSCVKQFTAAARGATDVPSFACPQCSVKHDPKALVGVQQ